MRNRWLLNLALAILVVALAVFGYYGTSEESAATGKPLAAFVADTVRRIEIVRSHRPPIVIEHGASGWRLMAPVPARANTYNVDMLLRLGAIASEGRIDAAAGALARYGLEPPQLTVRFDDVALDFGALHPLKDQHYMRLGSAVHLVASRHFATAAIPYGNLIDTRLLEEGRRPIALHLPDFSLALTDGTWVRQPPNPKLSGDQINAFMDEWRYARALSVEPYSGRPPSQHITITFTSDQGPPQKLELGIVTRQPELVLLRPDERLAYHFPEPTGKRLLTLTEANPEPD